MESHNVKIALVTIIAAFMASSASNHCAQAVGGRDGVLHRTVVNVGKTFTVRWKANPSTGYSWEWTNKQDLDGIVELVDQSFTPRRGRTIVDTSAPGMSGAPGMNVFVFKALREGDYRVEFVYRRPWLPITDDLEQRAVYITIKP